MRTPAILAFFIVLRVTLATLAGADANKPDVIVHYSETYVAFPDIIRLKTGKLLMVAREGRIHMIDREKGRVIGKLSADGGRTWDQPMVICDHAGTDDRDPFVHQTRDGVIWVGCQGQRPEQDYDTYIIRSFDNAKTWERPILLSRSHNEHFIMYPVMEMSNGEFLWMGCSRLIKLHEDGTRERLAPQGKNFHGTFILKNPDAKEGFRWEGHIQPQLGSFDEWDIEETQPGHLVAIMRSPAPWFTWAESNDYGRTWTEAVPSTIRHNHGNRPRIDKLDGGVLVVSHCLRRANRILAIMSFDGGRTWKQDRIVTVLNSPEYCPTADFGYTAMVKASEEKYLFIYYAYPGKESAHRGIFGNFVSATAFQP